MPAAKKTGSTATGKRPSKTRRQRRERTGAPLTRERIVKTALDLVDREGLKSLSMRKLGAALGVDPMAVYYHIPNKHALLDAIVEAVMSSIDLRADSRSEPPEKRVMWAAHAYRDALLAHVNALPILLTHGPSTPAALRPVELLVGILRDAGLPPAQALAGMNAIAAAVRGIAGMVTSSGGRPRSKEELEAFARSFPAGELPHLCETMQHMNGFYDQGFDFGIRALARGLIAEAKS